MPTKTNRSNNPAASAAESAAENMTESARRTVASIADAARDAGTALDDSRSTAAEGLDAAASAVHDRVADLPGGETVRNVARATADRLSSSADYVRTHDAKRMMADVESLVRSNPAPALAIAATVGFLLGRALSRD